MTLQIESVIDSDLLQKICVTKNGPELSKVL